MDYVEAKGTHWETKLATAQLKELWVTQIHQRLDMLHEITVIWGDVKPQNILIDYNDGLWFISFGGGWTDGWVDERVFESKEEDLQGLQRVLDFLNNRS